MLGPSDGVQPRTRGCGPSRGGIRSRTDRQRTSWRRGAHPGQGGEAEASPWGPEGELPEGKDRRRDGSEKGVCGGLGGGNSPPQSGPGRASP